MYWNKSTVTYAQDIKNIHVLSDLVGTTCARISSRWCFAHYFKTDTAIITRHINISSFFHQVYSTEHRYEISLANFSWINSNRGKKIRRIYWNNEAVMFHRRKFQVFKHISAGVLIREKYHAWTTIIRTFHFSKRIFISNGCFLWYQTISRVFFLFLVFQIPRFSKTSLKYDIQDFIKIAIRNMKHIRGYVYYV